MDYVCASVHPFIVAEREGHGQGKGQGQERTPSQSSLYPPVRPHPLMRRASPVKTLRMSSVTKDMQPSVCPVSVRAEWPCH